MTTPDSASPLDVTVRALLDEWADAACIYFVSWSSGERTTDTVARSSLVQLVHASMNMGRKATLDAVLRGLRSEDDGQQLRAIIASVEDMRSNARHEGSEPA